MDIKNPGGAPPGFLSPSRLSHLRSNPDQRLLVWVGILDQYILRTHPPLITTMDGPIPTALSTNFQHSHPGAIQKDAWVGVVTANQCMWAAPLMPAPHLSLRGRPSGPATWYDAASAGRQRDSINVMCRKSYPLRPDGVPACGGSAPGVLSWCAGQRVLLFLALTAVRLAGRYSGAPVRPASWRR
jgi:hypothetical protein